MFWQNPNRASFPRAILHIDGDAFFASCEQAIHPELKGVPVITGKERGIVSSASYEAKALGIQRGVRLSDVHTMCPGAVMLPSDYETYSLFSKRLFSIMRQFSGVVEEYGIDEGFVDITGMQRPLNMNYRQIADSLKVQVQKELDITVSVGLAGTKVLAKFASKYKKPNGLTVISNRNREKYLAERPVEFVWGIGANTAARMHGMNIHTAQQFADMPFETVETVFTKPQLEIWQELNGNSVYDVMAKEKQRYASISKTKTFTPPSRTTSFIFSQLVKNLENACIKARRYRLVGKRLHIFLKTQDFETHGIEIDLSRASAYPNDMTEILAKGFNQIAQPGMLYRATGVTLSALQEDRAIQSTLFEQPVQLEKMKRVYAAVDETAGRFGKHAIHLGASVYANRADQHTGNRGEKAHRKQTSIKGESPRRRVGIPMLFTQVK